MLSRLFIAALWSPAGNALTSWLSFVMSYCVLSRSHVVSWVRCGTWLYRFLIYATFLTLSMQYLIVLPVNMLQVACAILYTSLYEMLLLVAYARCKCLDEYSFPHSLIKQSMDIDKRLYCNHTCKLTPTEVYNYTFSKTCLKRPPKKTKMVVKTNYRLMQTKSIAEWSILQYFRPSLSYHLSLRSMFFFVFFEWPLKIGFTALSYWNN